MSAKEDKQLANKWDTQNAFDAVRREARVEGAEQKSYKVVANLIQQLGLNDEAAAGTVGLGRLCQQAIGRRQCRAGNICH